VLALQTPLAEVLAVVAENAITVLTYTGAGAANHVWGPEARQVVGSDPGASSTREASKRNFLHRSPEHAVPETPVVNDPAAAGINTVMDKAEARSDKVCPQRGFLVVGQKSVIAPRHRGRQPVTQSGTYDWNILPGF
jgi:hypothetical protein